MRILQGFFKGVQKGFRKGHLEGFIRVLQGFFRLKNSEKGSARACSRDSRVLWLVKGFYEGSARAL